MSKRKETPNTLKALKEQAIGQDGPPKKTAKKQKRIRTSYDLPDGMREELRDIGYGYRTSASSVVTYFLADAIKRYKAGDLPIEPHLIESESLKFLHDIEVEYPVE